MTKTIDSTSLALDETDRRILQLLQEDGRLSNARLAERLNLSETPVWRRMRRLEEEGYIDGYHAQLNKKRLGIGLSAFVLIDFASHTDVQVRQFEEAIQSIPEILSCHNVTGDSDYQLHVVARDLESYGNFVAQVLRKLPGVKSIHSSLSMREVKASGKIPVGL